MKEASIVFFEWLSQQSDFVSMIGVDGDGFSKLYPVLAPEDVGYPFATYRLREAGRLSKDAREFVAVLALFFSVDQYDACCEATDVIADAIADQYEWITSEIDMDDEGSFYIGFINFKITQPWAS